MNHVTELIDRYIAIWNEADSSRRRELIKQTWTENATYVDPLMRAEGHTGIDAMVTGVQKQFPAYRFRRISGIDEHHHLVRFTWELGPEGAPAFAGGVDFGEMTDGRLQAIIGFLDFAPSPVNER